MKPKIKRYRMGVDCWTCPACKIVLPAAVRCKCGASMATQPKPRQNAKKQPKRPAYKPISETEFIQSFLYTTKTEKETEGKN